MLPGGGNVWRRGAGAARHALSTRSHTLHTRWVSGAAADAEPRHDKAPEMLEKVDFILDHYAGKYETLKRMLTDKYGAEGVLKDEPLAAGSSEEGKKMQ